MTIMPNSDSLKLVLPAGFEESNIVEFASHHALEMVRRTEKDESRGMPLTLTFAGTGDDSSLQYVEHYKIGIGFVRIRGSRREALADRVREHYFVIDEAEIRRRASNSDVDERHDAMLYLAAYVEEVFDPELMDLFERGSSDEDVEVREGCFLAIASAGWRELLPVLRRMEKNETDKYLKGRYANLIRTIESSG